MTVLSWDQPGDRRFETGVDRGVLYLTSGVAMPWNGLKSITEKTSRDVQSYYIDGQKYLDKYTPGAYSATLEAYTYPEELDTLLGLSEFAPGVYLHDQSAGLFSLSYRTGIGNDLDSEAGYRIHIVYNILAIPSDVAMASASDSINLNPFSWAISGTPSQMFGARPTAHLSVDSTRMDPAMLVFLETLLYGSDDSDPMLPSMVDLVNLLAP